LKARAYSAPCSGFTYLRLASFSPDISPFHWSQSFQPFVYPTQIPAGSILIHIHFIILSQQCILGMIVFIDQMEMLSILIDCRIQRPYNDVGHIHLFGPIWNLTV
jgi:hypothetical protein